MLFKVAQIFAVTSMVTFVAALPSPVGLACSDGTEQCCDTIAPVESPTIRKLLSQGILERLDAIPIVIGYIAQVGIACSPITDVGNSSTCNRQTVCCTGDNFGDGKAVLGCIPIRR